MLFCAFPTVFKQSLLNFNSLTVKSLFNNNLSTIVNVLIEIGGGNTDYVNTSYSYIQKHYTNITKEVSSTIKKTWTAEKSLFVH